MGARIEGGGDHVASSRRALSTQVLDAFSLGPDVQLDRPGLRSSDRLRFALGVDRDDGSAVEVLNAGHPRPVHLHSRTPSQWAASDRLLCLANARHSLHTTNVHGGHLIVICTDGPEHSRGRLNDDALVVVLREDDHA